MKRLALIILCLAALLGFSTDGFAQVEYSGNLKVVPKKVKKGKRVTATADGCKSGSNASIGAYTAQVEFVFLSPKRADVRYRVTTGPDGTASYAKKLGAAGVWEVRGQCLYITSYGEETPFGYAPVLVHVTKKKHKG